MSHLLGTLVQVEGEQLPRERSVADVIETGVPGLDVVRAEPGAQWRLVHRATGVLLSRVAVHANPQPLVRLARLLAPLTDWTTAELSVAGPVLRHAIEEGAAKCGLPLQSIGGDGQAPSGPPADDRELLLRVLRRVHTAVPPGTFATAIADLGPEERARLRAMLTDESSTTGAVVRPLPPSPGRPGAVEPPGSSRSGSAAG
jgi:hypothetical protein